MSQSPPSTLGKYQIIREIARSNDIVYEAYDPVMNRRVAVKELAMPGGASQQQIDDRIKRFLREARAAGSLVHPNIVTIYEVGEDSGRRYIAMEYLDGQNLRNLLDTKGFIEPKRAVEITTEVLKGLEFAHGHGVIHRDIKPDNIQLLENGEVKITDFGIARLTFEPNLTMDGQVFGTPSYMSPEQINGRELDARSDLFSVGVILYEMVAGRKPFTGDSVVSITYAVMNSEPSQPQQCGPSLWQVIRQALDKSPQLRWGSAKDMGDALRSVQAQFASGSIVADPVSLPAPSYPTMGPVNPGPPPVQTHVAPGQPNPYGGGLTPYGTPMPGTISQQPYQPYGQAPPQQAYAPAPPPPYGAAYGQPYGAAPQPYPPAVQPYGSYQPQALTPVPTYYPPPPKAPVMTPEARVFFGRVLKAVLLIGMILAIVVVAIVQLANAPFKKSGIGVPSDGTAQSGTPAPTSGASGVPTSQQGDLPIADKASQARQAVQDAIDEPDPVKRRGLFSKASRLWSEVVDEGNPAKGREQAVNTFLEAADVMMKAGDRDGAMQALYEARGFAGNVDTLDEQVQIRQRQLYGDGG